MALKKPPGAERNFAFMEWPHYRKGLWQALLQEAERQRQSDLPPLSGADRDGAVLGAARCNAERAGVSEFLSLQQLEVGGRAPVFSHPGLAICNPPYGTRLGRGELAETYGALGRLYAESLSGWQRAFLCPEARLARDTGLPLTQLAALQNGGIRVGLFAVT